MKNHITAESFGDTLPANGEQTDVDSEVQYAVYYGIREISSESLAGADEETVFDEFMANNESDNLILTTESHEEALDVLNSKMPVMRVGNETMVKKCRPVECYWIEEIDSGEYAGTMEHSAWKGVSQID